MIEALENQARGFRRGGGVAAWQRIATAVEGAIDEARSEAGARLPAEGELARLFAVNRHTVRRAIQALAERGRVRTEHGRGSFVQDVVIDYPIGERVSFSANLLAQGLHATHQPREVSGGLADATVAKALGIKEGAPVVTASGVGGTEQVPLVVGASYYCPARLAGIEEQLRREPSVSKVLGALGHATYKRLWTRLAARLPTLDEAAALRQPPGEPVLTSEAVDAAPDGTPLRYGISVFAGGRVHVTIGS